MTQSLPKTKNRVRPDKLLLTFSFVLLSGLFIKNSGLFAQYVRASLQLCVKTVIPSVFPCAVLSGIFISLGGGELIASLFGWATRKFFKISGAGATVILLGFFCGFPVGAVAGAALYHRGELSECELSRLMLFANVPSPAFVISAVGESMLKSRKAGIVLYAVLIFVSVMIGFFQRFFKRPAYTELAVTKKDRNFALGVASSISSAASSMLNLCASVVFFSVLTKAVLSLLQAFRVSPFVAALIDGIFELSGGCAAAADLGGASALGLSAFILGWSGFCVHFQIISAVGIKMKLGSYFATKLICAVLTAAVTLLISSLFDLF